MDQLFVVQNGLFRTEDFVQVENQYGASICLRKLIFYFAFFENVKINMEQLFVVQIGTFSAWEPRCCELRETLIKHKGWGALFDTLGPQGADLCPKEASQSLTFHSVCVKFAAMRRPWRKSINLESK